MHDPARVLLALIVSNRPIPSSKNPHFQNETRRTTFLVGVANGTSKNVGLGKFWQDLESSEAFLTSLKVSFLHGLFLLF